jgi:hypothetical protein
MMTIKSKEEIESQLGNYPSFEGLQNRLLDKVGYLGGCPAFDSKLANKKRFEYLIDFHARPKGLEIQAGIGFKLMRIALSFEQIDFIVIEAQKQITEKKEKSIVGRALLGGILLGPVGAIVGGMTGIGNKEVKVTPVDNILSIKLNDDNTLLTFSVDNKDCKAVENYLQKFFKDKYRRPDEVVSFHVNEKTNFKSVADELIKLKSLVDSGVLTQEEFQIQKRNLLGN